jgi:hypothetical protein
MDNMKAPGMDGITDEVYKSDFEIFPEYLTAIYNNCYNRGIFPKRWKTSKMIAIVKPGKENSDEPSKFRPISLLKVGGKKKKKKLINRINHQIYSHALMCGNQYGFMPQKSTIDANMAVKRFVEPALTAGDILVLISLDVKDAFNAAFWPSILNGLKDYNCSKNFYNLSKSFFSNRSAVISSNNIVIHKKVTKGTPQGFCSGPGYWNIQ